MDYQVACFEVVTQTEFGTDYIFNTLIKETEIQRRQAFLAERMLNMSQEDH